MLRLLHLSDLHLGTPSQIRGRIPQRLASLVPGLRGHSNLALLALDKFVDHQARDAQRRGADVRVVVTGDLTAHGADAQFELARQVLAGQTAIGGRSAIGVQTAPSGDATVPGNHDDWGGRLPPARRPGREWGRTFDPLPAVSDLVPIEGWHLRLLRIDTGTDVSTSDALLARGACQSQIASLHRLLETVGPRRPRELRALLLHHAPSHRNRAPLHALELTPPSRRDLDALIADAEIGALLSGHVHTPSLDLRSVGGRTVLDAVSGTATQHTDAQASPPLPRLQSNAVLVHDLDPVDGALRWTARVVRRSLGRFVPHRLPDGSPWTLEHVFREPTP